MQLDALNKLQPITCASWTLNPAELNYSTTHKEPLEAVWSLCHFKDLIYGYPVHVKTDHAAVELLNSKHLMGKLARWSLIVQDFNPSFSYLPKKANVVVDALSRHNDTLQISGGEDFKSFLTKEQRANPFCAHLLYYLESSDDTILHQRWNLCMYHTLRSKIRTRWRISTNYSAKNSCPYHYWITSLCPSGRTCHILGKTVVFNRPD